MSLAIWDYTVFITCHPTQAHTPRLNPSQGRPVLDLSTPKGWKAELTWVTGYIPRWSTRPQTVTHPSTNRARCRVSTMIETNALPLCQATCGSNLALSISILILLQPASSSLQQLASSVRSMRFQLTKTVKPLKLLKTINKGQLLEITIALTNVSSR